MSIEIQTQVVQGTIGLSIRLSLPKLSFGPYLNAILFMTFKRPAAANVTKQAKDIKKVQQRIVKDITRWKKEHKGITCIA